MDKIAQLESENSIAAEVYKEMEAEEKGLPVPEKKAVEESQPEKKESEEAPPAKEEGEEVVDPDKATEKEAEAKEVVEKAKEEKPAEEKPITDDEVNAYALKHSVTHAEAKEEIQADRAVLKNYKTPEEMARAVRFSRSEADKLKSQIEKKQAQPVFVPLTDEQFLAQSKNHLAKDQEKIVNKFRQQYPAKSELMTDEAIMEEVVDRSLVDYKSWAEKKSTEVIHTAKNKREKLLADIADDDRKYVPAVKAILDSTDPRQILHEGFDIEDLLRHARGDKKSYMAAIKEAEERGAKREREGKVILGVKTTSDGKGTVKVKSTSGLNAKQMAQAESQFRNETPEVAHKYFKEIYEDDLKENPSFVP